MHGAAMSWQAARGSVSASISGAGGGRRRQRQHSLEPPVDLGGATVTVIVCAPSRVTPAVGAIVKGFKGGVGADAQTVDFRGALATHVVCAQHDHVCRQEAPCRRQRGLATVATEPSAAAERS